MMDVELGVEWNFQYEWYSHVCVVILTEYKTQDGRKQFPLTFLLINVLWIWNCMFMREMYFYEEIPRLVVWHYRMVIIFICVCSLTHNSSNWWQSCSIILFVIAINDTNKNRNCKNCQYLLDYYQKNHTQSHTNAKKDEDTEKKKQIKCGLFFWLASGRWNKRRKSKKFPRIWWIYYGVCWKEMINHRNNQKERI